MELSVARQRYFNEAVITQLGRVNYNQQDDVDMKCSAMLSIAPFTSTFKVRFGFKIRCKTGFEKESSNLVNRE